jgi:hypothetical protein
MTKNNRFSPASEEGHFYGLVDEGEYLRQSLLYKQILPRTPSWLKTILPSVTKNLFNQRNSRLIKNLHACKVLYNCRESSTDVRSALQIHLFLQNKAKFRKVKFNVTKVLTKDYNQMDTWSSRKNEPKRTQNEPNFSQ